MAHSLEFLAGGGRMGALMRAHDWSSSPLGPPDVWPQSLRTVVALLLQSQFPMFVAWGDALGFLYNDSYAEILGAKHPRALGSRFYDIWSEIWPDISPLVDAAMAGQATYREDLLLVMNRKGYDEETTPEQRTRIFDAPRGRPWHRPDPAAARVLAATPAQSGVARSSCAPARDARDASAASAARSDGAARRGQILLVEDDKEVSALTREMLGCLGFTVIHVASPEAALGALADGRTIDVVLSDIMMPGGVSGLDLAREIRRRHPDLLIVLTTGYVEAAGGMKDGEFVLLPKPYSLEALADALGVEARP
jgi:CheY-like chemotaxis protein